MSQELIQRGIAAVQAGQFAQADQLLRTALSNPEITGHARAVTLMWLSETNSNLEFKVQCYQAAAQADPQDLEIQQRLGQLQAMLAPPVAQIPPPPPISQPVINTPPAPSFGTGPSPTQAVPQLQTQEVPRLWEFGVKGGPNGIGTAFMVVRDGLFASTRHIVGNEVDVTLVSRDGREMEGKVVRSYPIFDLAFIRTRLSVPFIRDMTPLGTVPPENELIADDYTEKTLQGRCRATKRAITPGWFPTTFQEDVPRSFSGAPLIDAKGDLAGMLTRNADRNSQNLYGLHISIIRRKIEEYYNEMQADPNRTYCGTCGSLSKAGSDGLYYCEICGALFPHAERLHRTPHPKTALYYDKDQQKRGNK